MNNRKGYHGGSDGRRIPAKTVQSMWVDTPTPCSCHMCGNPRKWWNEETVQERRAFICDADDLTGY